MEEHPTLLRLPQVVERVGISRSQIYRYLSDGRFPKPVSVGDRSIAWSSIEVDAWVHARIVERDREPAAARERCARMTKLLAAQAAGRALKRKAAKNETEPA